MLSQIVIVQSQVYVEGTLPFCHMLACNTNNEVRQLIADKFVGFFGLAYFSVSNHRTVCRLLCRGLHVFCLWWVQYDKLLLYALAAD